MVSQSSKKNTGMAVIANILFFIPLLTDAKKDPFVKFHIKQGLVLFIGWVIAAIIARLPVLFLFAWILDIALLVLLIMGILNALAGKEEQLPLIGKYAEKFNF